MKRAGWGMWLLLSLPLTAGAQGYSGAPPNPRPDGRYQISGKVVDALTAQPIPGAEISISTGPQGIGEPFEILETGPDGSFRVDRLAEGKYTIRAQRRGYAPQAYLQHENYWSGIAVGPGKDAQHLSFPLFPSAAIAGQVLDENGEGVRNAKVKLWTREVNTGKLSVDLRTFAFTDDRGRYRFDHLASGKYTVSVEAAPWYSKNRSGDSELGPESRENTRLLGVTVEDSPVNPGSPRENDLPDVNYPTLFFPNEGRLESASWFDLRPGDEQSADLRVMPIPAIHLVVRTESKEGATPNLLIGAEGAGEDDTNDMPILPSQISPEIVEFSGLQPGKYRVVIPDDGTGQPRTEDVELDRDSEFDFRSSPPRGPEIKGELHLPDISTESDNKVMQLVDQSGHSFYGEVIPKQSGAAAPQGTPATIPGEFTFEFHGVPARPGVYEVSLNAALGAAIAGIQVKGAQIDGNRITIDGVSAVQLDVQVVQSRLSLSGTALKKGHPFAGAMMLLLPQNGQVQQVRRDQSDSDGTFTLPNVLPGNYKLLALENGWKLPWADAALRKELLEKGIAVQVGKDEPKPVTVEVQ